MPLSPGSRLGPYEILAALGAGGMGEVYRARDAKLGREVAIKVVLESMVADPERSARFRREAQVLAALNHPNIATLFGMEEADGRHFLVMELVDGEDLSQRIARGAIPLAEALPFARQIEANADTGRPFTLTRDGRRFLMVKTPPGKPPSQGAGFATRLIVVQNWFAELKAAGLR